MYSPRRCSCVTGKTQVWCPLWSQAWRAWRTVWSSRTVSTRTRTGLAPPSSRPPRTSRTSSSTRPPITSSLSWTGWTSWRGRRQSTVLWMPRVKGFSHPLVRSISTRMARWRRRTGKGTTLSADWPALVGSDLTRIPRQAFISSWLVWARLSQRLLTQLIHKSYSGKTWRA